MLQQLTATHIVGAAATLLLITLVGLYSGKKVKNAADFSGTARKSGTAIIVGALMGTLVGGASTIGTAQLAFVNGFSAWWFTLGGGIACLILGLFYSVPLHRSRVQTVPELLTREYGGAIGPVSSVLSSMGIFLNVVAQILSGVALITSVTSLSVGAAALITVGLMACYVVFGGVWGCGMVGMVKLVLLYAAIIGGGVLAYVLGGGWGGFSGALDAGQYFNLFSRGVLKDGGAGLSLVLGVLSTQTYIQAVVSARSEKIGRRGAIWSAFLTAPMGLAGIFIGMYMHRTAPELSAASAFPVFILEQMPPFVAGVILAGLLVAVVGTGAGLSLGISSILSHDLIAPRLKKPLSGSGTLALSRGLILAVLAIAVVFAFTNVGSLILSWSFLSMGLRGAVVFAPLCMALFAPGKYSSRGALSAVIAGPVGVLIGSFILPKSIDPVFLGVAVAFAIMLFSRKKQRSELT